MIDVPAIVRERVTRAQWIDDEHLAGYLNARDPCAPDPGPNRSAAYRHSFAVRRAEMTGDPIPASVSRQRARDIYDAEMSATLN